MTELGLHLHGGIAVLLWTLGVMVGVWGALLLTAAVHSAVSLGRERPISRSDARRAIEEAISECRATGLSGWPLVEHAQRLVARRMPEYGFDNGFELPARAFTRGRGYCWQRSGALRLVLEGLGFAVERVFAFRNRFPDRELGGRRIPGLVAGHTWLRVSVGGERREVCPGRPENAPGRVHFRSLSPVRPWGAGIGVLSYLGCPVVNVVAAAVRALRR